MKPIKKSRFLNFCIVATALLCSCSKEPVESFAGGDPTSPILPDAGVAATVETKADLSGAVTTTSFPANTTKLFAVVGYKGSTAPSTNWSSPYINGVIVNSNSSGVLSFATPQYYPVNGDKVFFYAYSPASGSYTAGNGATTPKVAWTINGTQDIMGAKVTTGIAKAASGTQSQPVFAFTHKLKQVKFKVVKDASLENDIKLTSLLIIGAKTSATIDVSTGNVTWGATTGNLTVYSNSTGQTITTSAASVGSPIMFEPGTTFKVRAVAGGQQYADVTVTLSGTNAGQAGYSHEVTLKFMSNTIVPTATITNWTKTSTDCDVDVEVGPIALKVTGITLNSSSSHTVSRAGGPFSLVAQTNFPPHSNISWVVKDANGNEVGRTTAIKSYNTATVTFDENTTDFRSRLLTLYWTYEGSEPQPYTGKITQNGATITDFGLTSGQWNNNDKQTHVYAGVRTIRFTGDYAAGQQYKLNNNGTAIGPFTMSESGTVKLPLNETGSTIRWEIQPINASDNTTESTGLYLEQTTDTYNSINTGFVYVNDTYLIYNANKTTLANARTACSNLGGVLPVDLSQDLYDKTVLHYGSYNDVNIWLERGNANAYMWVYHNRPYQLKTTSFGDFQAAYICVPE